MPPSVRRLLRQPGLDLRLLTPEHTLMAGALDVAVQWVHSSDLADPTPFLSPGQVLLTTGTQFPAEAGQEDNDTAADFYGRYVARLSDHGIAALGFGTEVISHGTPGALVHAGQARGMPVFEVPYRTPFIAIARLAADLVAEENYARHTWALQAQRAISLAALQPDGLSATLSELSSQLGHWVALFDAAGNLDRLYPPAALEGQALDAVRAEAAKLLRRRQRAASSAVYGSEMLTLQTLGRPDRLRGVLALGGGVRLDSAGQEIVTSVIALAGLALEQNSALDRAKGHLRSGLLQAMLGGNTELASGISQEMWGPLPSAPVRVAVTDASLETIDPIKERLEIRVEQQPGCLFYAVWEGRLILVLDGADPSGVLEELCRDFGIRAGLSAPSAYDALPRALAQAEQSLNRAFEGESQIIEFGSISQQGVLAFLAGSGGREIGREVLEPLTRSDAEEGTSLLSSVRVWLEHNAQLEPAAKALGVHRHTMRGRIQQAEGLLGRDLSTFRARADLWAAILVAG